MKCLPSVVALCLVLRCASLACARPLDRSLKQTCPPRLPSAAQALNDASTSIASSLSTAVNRAVGGSADVTASSAEFAQALRTAYTRFIRSHIRRTVAAEGSACDAGANHVTATASEIGTATGRAFLQSTNPHVPFAANCFGAAVVSAATGAMQNRWCAFCRSTSEASIARQLDTNGFSQTLTTVFRNVFVDIRAGIPASC